MPLLKTTNYPQNVIYVFPTLRFFLDPSSSTCLILRHSVTGSNLIGGCLSPSTALDVKGAREVLKQVLSYRHTQRDDSQGTGREENRSTAGKFYRSLPASTQKKRIKVALLIKWRRCEKKKDNP